MTRVKNISTLLLLTISLLAFPTTADAQRKKIIELPDTTPLFNGIEVSAELVGIGMMQLGDYGQYEGALRINLKDRYFPVVELGYGKCDYEDKVTNIIYKTNAPYGKVGIDFNVLKNKHDIYRLYIGARYAYTSYKVDFSCPNITDAYWGSTADWSMHDMKCSYHWAEVLFGTQVKLWGPFELGWSLRYRKRISYSEGDYSKSWYVPGYGKSGKTNIMATFHVIFAI